MVTFSLMFSQLKVHRYIPIGSDMKINIYLKRSPVCAVVCTTLFKKKFLKKSEGLIMTLSVRLKFLSSTLEDSNRVTGAHFLQLCCAMQ